MAGETVVRLSEDAGDKECAKYSSDLLFSSMKFAVTDDDASIEFMRNLLRAIYMRPERRTLKFMVLLVRNALWCNIAMSCDGSAQSFRF